MANFSRVLFSRKFVFFSNLILGSVFSDQVVVLGVLVGNKYYITTNYQYCSTIMSSGLDEGFNWRRLIGTVGAPSVTCATCSPLRNAKLFVSLVAVKSLR